MTPSSKRQRPIYMDYHATTPMDPRVVEHMLYYMTEAFGNASSTDHTYGDEAEDAVVTAKKQVASLISTNPGNVIFTSGATESINIALQGHCLARNKKQKIAISPLEHKAVIDVCKALEKQNRADLFWLKVDQLGRIDLEYIENTCKSGIDLICVMAANNEIGNIYPIQEIAKIAMENDAAFFCDATQAVGKLPIDFDEWGITYLALSAHKLYGPKGCGALIVQRDHNIRPLIYGGGHQQGLRSGTLNVPGIVGLGEACKLREQERVKDEKQIQNKRDRLQKLLQENIIDLVVNGDQSSRLAGNLHISIPATQNNIIIAHIRHQLAISTGSACSSGVETSSHVLHAIGLNTNLIEGALRIGLGKFTKEEDTDLASYILTNITRKLSRFRR